MPPSVPTRPASGAGVITSWGQWVHDWLKKRNLIRGTAGNQTITNVEADIAGQTLTVGPGWFFVMVTADIDVSVTGTGVISIKLRVDGVNETPVLEYFSGTVTGRATVAQIWLLNIAGAGVLQTRIIKAVNGGTATLLRDNSALAVI